MVVNDNVVLHVRKLVLELRLDARMTGHLDLPLDPRPPSTCDSSFLERDRGRADEPHEAVVGVKVFEEGVDHVGCGEGLGARETAWEEEEIEFEVEILLLCYRGEISRSV